MIVNDEEVTVLYEKETITKLIYLQKLWLPTHFVIFSIVWFSSHTSHLMLNLLHFVMIQVASLQEERQSLVLDRDKLEERLAMAESLEDLRCFCCGTFLFF